MAEQIEQIESSIQTVDGTLAVDGTLVGIRGWLILPAIGFLLGPITDVVLLIVASGILLVVALSAGAEPFIVEYGKAFVHTIIVAAIWIPYFKVSKRVKATFTHSGEKGPCDKSRR